jgi:hypothetical protein
VLDRPSTRVDLTGYESDDDPKTKKTEAGKKPIKTQTASKKPIRAHGAASKVQEKAWKKYFEAQPDVKEVLSLSRLKDPVSKKGIGSGVGTGPKDLTVVWTTGEATVIEVSTEREFARGKVSAYSRKAFQEKHTQRCLAKEGGAVTGPDTTGKYPKVVGSWNTPDFLPNPKQTYNIPGRPAPVGTKTAPAPRGSPATRVLGVAGAAGLAGRAVTDLYERRPGQAVVHAAEGVGVAYVLGKVPELGPLVAAWLVSQAYDETVQEHANAVAERLTGSHEVLGATVAAGWAVGESAYEGFFKPVGTDIGEGLAAATLSAGRAAVAPASLYLSLLPNPEDLCPGAGSHAPILTCP